MSHKVEKNAKLESIQYLRAFAALLVVVCHGVGEIMHTAGRDIPIAKFLTDKGLFGVDIFFVISGFIMFYVSARKIRDHSFSINFMRDRILRIVPLYWLVTTASLAITLLLPGAKRNNDVSVPYLINSYLFIPTRNPATGDPQPFVGLGWTLNYEMFFYALIALTAIFVKDKIGYAVVAVLALLIVVGQVVPSDSVVFASWTHTIIAEFAFGMSLAMFVASGRRLAKPACILMVVIGMTLWLLSIGNGDEIRGFYWGAPAALIVSGVVIALRNHTHRGLWGKAFLEIGNASFSLYLLHLFCMRGTSILFKKMGISIVNAALPYMVVFIASSIFVSVLSYRFFERPIQSFGHRRFAVASGRS